MFRVGQYVILHPKRCFGLGDDEIGVVTFVEPHPYFEGVELVTVFWNDIGYDDGGPWRSHWLLLV